MIFLLGRDTSSLREDMRREWYRSIRDDIYDSFLPLYSFEGGADGTAAWALREQIDGFLPFYGYLEEEMRREDSVRWISLEEPGEEQTDQNGEEEDGKETNQSETASLREGEETDDFQETEAVWAENEKASESESAAEFVPHEQAEEISLDSLSDYETLLQEFYTVDANTMADSASLNAKQMAGRDLTITKDDSSPQILIYHTHSQEDFADSVPGDPATSIVGIGAYLAEILEDTYGYGVIHHTAAYDAEGRENAYARALPDIEQVLAENPSIQVVIDLHRDEVAEDTRLVTDIDGRPTARFMFFNGLSRTQKTGNIAYLYNENLEGNLAFSFQMQKKAYEYYPGLTRKIYLKGYRYNMHLKERYLLVELGAQNNTVEEARNACEPMAHILDMVLSGQ